MKNQNKSKLESSQPSPDPLKINPLEEDFTNSDELTGYSGFKSY
jgi:hypothetical protein